MVPYLWWLGQGSEPNVVARSVGATRTRELGVRLRLGARLTFHDPKVKSAVRLPLISLTRGEIAARDPISFARYLTVWWYLVTHISFSTAPEHSQSTLHSKSQTLVHARKIRLVSTIMDATRCTFVPRAVRGA